MTKRPKTKKEDVDSYRQEDKTPKNSVPAGLASYDTSKPKPKKYEYDLHLDPQLVKMTLKVSSGQDQFELFTNTISIPFKLGKAK
ncbi:MAG: hypothetical protein IBX72_12320 [Nitrospirae bacterium]|nr:hypothetical protein [Nitrospirota bacterium]